MFELERITKTFDSKAALSGIDLGITPHKTTVLIGPSGCGKSTLLRLMIGLLKPDTGDVRFDNEVIGSGNIRRLRHRMGYVIQDGGLFPHLTALENVTLLARHLGEPSDKAQARVLLKSGSDNQ